MSAEPAYHNQHFLDSDEGRPVRILAEYLEPLYRLKEEGIHDTIVFFGSARLEENGPMGKYYRDARTLACKLADWSSRLHESKRFVICSGGGGGIMEAANRGARDGGADTIGFNIGLPYEQRPNPYVTPSLLFEFHYFFMRKLWFSHLARALIVFPGGFGTLDELMEMLTLAQTKKLDRKVLILLYGSDYWKDVINLNVLADRGMIDPEDLKLVQRVDDVDTAFQFLKDNLPKEKEAAYPSFAKAKFSKTSVAD
ncbi:MAG: TIGR00730 family Rossman fold protein [Bdellovibrio sp.]|nr:MAG: TIGR00730 family Rossman fold protein [Bdellovibrio sp.]